MKYFWISLLFSCSLLLNIQRAFGQSDTLHLYQAYHSFSNQEKAEWTAFENNWSFVEYPILMQTQKIKKLNCKNCENFYADIYLEINDSGKLSTVIFKNGKSCGTFILSENLIKEFENSVKSHSFNYLKNKAFIARFGHILKC